MFQKKQASSYLATTTAYKQFRTLRIVGLLAGIFFVLGSGFMVFFLYRNVYVPIGETENMSITEPLSVQVIDFRNVELVEKTWTEKANTETRVPTHDPFYATASTSTTSTQPPVTTTTPTPANVKIPPPTPAPTPSGSLPVSTER
jgi:hypothetical protein